jgi:flagellar biosynthesis chaperone FliJ
MLEGKEMVDFIDKEAETFSKRCDELQDFITHLQKELEQANNDRNAVYGALQQCLKIKKMLNAPILQILQKQVSKKEGSNEPKPV